MNDISNRLAVLSHGLESVQAIVELVASGIVDDTQSASLWGVAELIRVYADRIQALADEHDKPIF
jgi:hypothetical protein